MTSLVAVLRLATRLLDIRSAEGLVRLGVQVGAVAVVILSLLGMWAIPGAIQSRQARADARELNQDGRTVLHADESVLDWRGQPISRVLIAESPDGPPPAIPGVPTAPGVGEAVVSPALAHKIDQESDIDGLLGGAPVIGTIGEAGLTAPDELRLYLGVTEQAALPGVSGFGAPAHPVTIEAAFVAPMMLLFALLVVLPAVTLVMVATRYGARMKERRLRLLDTLGLRTSSLRLIMVVEAMICSLLGTLLGYVAFQVLSSTASSIPGVGLSWFPADVRVSTVAAVFIGAVVIVAVCLASYVNAGLPEALTVRPVLSRTRSGVVSLWLLVCGVVGVSSVGLVTPPLSNAEAFRVLAISVLAVAIGIPLGLPYLVRRIALARLRWPSQTSTTLGLRWLEVNPGSPSRVIAGVCAAILGLGVALPFTQLLSGVSTEARDQIHSAGGVAVLVRSAYTKLDLTKLQGDGLVSTFPIVTLRDDRGDRVSAVVASCEELDPFVDHPEACTDQIAWLRTEDVRTTSLSVQPGTQLTTARGVDLTVPPRSQSLDAKLHPAVDGWLVVPPTQIPESDVDKTEGALLFTEEGFDPSRIVAQVLAQDPTAQVDTGYAGWIAQSAKFATPIRLVFAGVVIGLLLATATLFLAALADQRERLRQTKYLRVVGAPSKVFRSALSIVIAVPALLGVTIATTVAVLAARVLAAMDGRAKVELLLYAGIWLVSLLVTGIVVGLTTTLATLQRSG